MKIVSDDDVFVLPLDKNFKNIIVTNEHKEKFINCLESYFVSKKKNKCMIYENDSVLNTNDLNFIYLSNDISLDSNMELKQKTILNNSIAEIINNNQEYFLSLENIRNELLELQTDKGMFRIQEIISKGLDEAIKIEFKEFNISSLLQMFWIDGSFLKESTKQIVLLNILLYEKRDKTNLVYIDNYVDDNLYNRIDKQSNNNYFLIDNDAIINSPDYYDLIILSNNDHITFDEVNNNHIKVLSYMNHPFIMNNRSLQNEKNVELFNNYYDNSSTFFIRNSSVELTYSL